MIVNCAWVTCKHNSENDKFKDNKKTNEFGCCNQLGIKLASDLKCCDNVDGLNCKNYLGSWGNK